MLQPAEQEAEKDMAALPHALDERRERCAGATRKRKEANVQMLHELDYLEEKLTAILTAAKDMESENTQMEKEKEKEATVEGG